MEKTEETFLRLAQELRDSFQSQTQSFPHQLAQTLCVALAENRRKDSMILFNLLKEFLAENELTHLLSATSEALTSKTGG